MNKKQQTIQKVLDDLANTDMFNGQYSWGSCQYETAAATYAAFQKLEDLYGFKEALSAMGCSIGDHKPIPEAELCLGFIESFKPTEADKLSNDPEWAQEQYDEIKEANPKTIDELLNALKDLAWDLWSAAPPILSDALGGHHFTCDPRLTLTTEGPILNRMAQGENYETGISCAILTHFYGASDFEGFST